MNNYILLFIKVCYYATEYNLQLKNRRLHQPNTINYYTTKKHNLRKTSSRNLHIHSKIRIFVSLAGS